MQTVVGAGRTLWDGIEGTEDGMVTQAHIAERVGLDVSSVNKILNQVKGPVFRKETIKEVFAVARELGYDTARETKHSLRAGKVELKAALEDVYNSYFGMGGRVLKPETLATIKKHFEQFGSRKKRSTA